MSAVLFVARTEIRRRLRRVVFLTLLVGLIGAAVLATAAGARRTESSLTRLNESSRSSSLQVFVASATKTQLAQFRESSDVESVAPGVVYFFSIPGAPTANLIGPIDDALGSTNDRPRLVRGRLPNPNAIYEIALNESVAAASNAGVGRHLDALAYTPAQAARVNAGVSDPGPPGGPKMQFDVVGIVRGPIDLGRTSGISIPIPVTRAFYRKYGNTIGSFGTGLLVRTKHGAADLATVSNRAQAIFGKSPGFSVSSLADQNDGAQGAIDVLAIALAFFCAVTALAGSTALAIVLGREINENELEQTTLQTLGLTRRERVVAFAPLTLLVGLGGSLLAIFGAVVLSSRFPVGVARRAEPHPGIAFDWTVLLLGAVLLLVVVLAISTIAAVRVTRTMRRNIAAATPLVEAVTRTSLAPTITCGLVMALQRRRGRASVPLLSTVVGVVIGVVGLSSALVYRANLDHLAATPRLYGWSWDLKAADVLSNEPSCTPQDFGVSRIPGVASLAAVCYGNGNVILDGRTTNGWGFVSIRGAIEPPMIRGRAPETADEVALGAKTMRAVHKTIGDLVVARGPNGGHSYRIVGEADFPELGQPQPLADGAAFSRAGFAPLFDQENFYRFLLARFTPGADRAAVVRRVEAIPQLDGVATATEPVEVSRVEQTSWTPIGIALLLGAIALIALAHALVSMVHRRRHDLAVLKTIGFRRGQIRAVVAWQATTLAMIALVVGLPLGLLAGGVVWRHIADGLGIIDAIDYPTSSLLLVIPAVLLLANVLAFAPALAAARTRASVALRSE